MAATTFAGQNIGAGKADRVRKGMYISTAMGAGYSVITGIVLLIFAPQVIGSLRRTIRWWNMVYIL